MDPERLAKIETLFHQLRNLPQAERAAFLERAAGTSPEIRSALESLLAHDQLNEASFHQAFVSPTEVVRKNTGERSSLVGRNIGPYHVLSFIAAGGMGEVYRARHSKLDRDVALKVLPAQVSQDPDRLRRSEREAKLLALLNHANIAAIYDFVESDGIQCLVLEYVEGQTLAEQSKGGRRRVAEALEIARQIAGALESAHERGIIHRDLKPGNVMITADGSVKVLDFGIAKILESETSVATAATTESVSRGVVLGTPAYMSPEQVKGQQINRTADIWAFGCVLYEMLTGRRTFDGDSTAQILGRVSETEPDWSALPQETPPEVSKLVQRCLRKDSRSRLQNIGDARIVIEEIQSAAPTALPARQLRATRGQLAWFSLLAVLTLVGVAAVLVAFRPRPRAPEMRLDITAPPAMNPRALASLSISPDGQQVVFAATVSGETQLWLRPLGSSSARPLAGTDNAESPFWSPDGQSVAFFADETLKRIEIDGGAPRVLANAPLGRGGTWSGDGVILFTPNNSGPIFRVSADGGKAEVVTKAEKAGGNHRLPRFMPDGRHFLYSSSDGAIYGAAVDHPEGRRILDETTKAEYSSAGYLVFERQAGLFAQRFDPVQLTLSGDPSPVADHILSAAWSVGDAGPIVYRTAPDRLDAQRQLVWFDRFGKALEQIHVPLTYPDLGVSLSPDARHLAIVGQPANAVRSYLWLLDLKRGVLSRFTDTLPATYPLWSADGSRIVFGHYEPNASMDLYQKRTNTLATEELLIQTTANKAATDWSTDGRFILYRSPDPKTGFDIWAVPVDGDRKAFPVVRTEANERDGQFSPDAKWIAYQSNESGRFEVYMQPFPGPGIKQPISTNGGAQVRWRSDGRELFYIALNGKLMSVPIRPAPDGDSVDIGTPVPLFGTRMSVVQFDRQQYFVSSDGQRFLMNIFNEAGTTSPIRVILNYRPKS